jgi:hypothetical protein
MDGPTQFYAPGDAGASLGGSIHQPSQLPPMRGASGTEQIAQPAPPPNLPLLNPYRHLPLASTTTKEGHDALLTYDASTGIVHNQQAILKSYYFSADAYILCLFACILRFVVLFMLAGAGSARYAGIYAVTFLLEFWIVFVIYLRDWSGSRKLLKLTLLFIATFLGVQTWFLVFTILGKITMNTGAIKWVSVSLSGVVTALYVGLSFAVVNVIQAKKICAYHTGLLLQYESLKSSPEDSDGSVPSVGDTAAKMKRG